MTAGHDLTGSSLMRVTPLSSHLSPTPLRVLIIDGHPAVGRGLKALIDEMPGLRVVGLTTRGECGLARAATATPDVALVDADLPGLCGLAAIRLLRRRLPKARIVALGIYRERARTALDAGAHTFMLKDAGYDALYEAIVAGKRDDTSVRPAAAGVRAWA
jgi:NarL family two-component system response regulator LiaR